MFNALYRRTPEILFIVAIVLLPVNMVRSVGMTLSMGQAGILPPGGQTTARLIEAVFTSLFMPAVLLGLAAIVANLRDADRG